MGRWIGREPGESWTKGGACLPAPGRHWAGAALPVWPWRPGRVLAPLQPPREESSSASCMAPGLGHSPASTQLAGLSLLVASDPTWLSSSAPQLFGEEAPPHPAPVVCTGHSCSAGSRLWFRCRHVETGAGVGVPLPCQRGQVCVRGHGLYPPQAFVPSSPILHSCVPGTGSDRHWDRTGNGRGMGPVQVLFQGKQLLNTKNVKKVIAQLNIA